ncbi:MAG: hypothetical protein H6559_10285 [Lewinellaceae bacterium]|nr:hypothetical protein [Lewinellaceae bacterium]
MKNIILISCLALSSFTAFAQNTWTGGTPGRETDWLEARNWSKQRVPGWDDNVLIPHLWHNNYPVVSAAMPPIAHLEVEGGARLIIKTGGQLSVDGSSTYNSGILLIGKIDNMGVLSVAHPAQEAIAGNSGNLLMQNSGKFYFDGGQGGYASRVGR